MKQGFPYCKLQSSMLRHTTQVNCIETIRAKFLAFLQSTLAKDKQSRESGVLCLPQSSKEWLCPKGFNKSSRKRWETPGYSSSSKYRISITEHLKNSIFLWPLIGNPPNHPQNDNGTGFKQTYCSKVLSRPESERHTEFGSLIQGLGIKLAGYSHKRFANDLMLQHGP